MAIGSSPSPLDSVTSGVARAENSDSEEERQGQAVQNNSAVVVYTSVSDPRVVAPRVHAFGSALVLVVSLQAVLAVVILTGGQWVPFYKEGRPAPTQAQQCVYGLWMVASACLPVAAWMRSSDFLKLYATVSTAFMLATFAAAMNSLLDVAWCLLCVPNRYLCGEIRKVSSPHCFLMQM
jgi:hypothetical protein